MSEFKEIDCRVTGKVQMVMFRDFVQRKARGLGIVGTVENIRDGSIHIRAQGSEDALESFVEQLHKGPFLAKVARVEVNPKETEDHFTGFKIIY